MAASDRRHPDAMKPDADPTAEVGSEGGSPGDVEVGTGSDTGKGSEAGETWRPASRQVREVVRDETGEGRALRELPGRHS